jgi:hypothetical protein
MRPLCHRVRRPWLAGWLGRLLRETGTRQMATYRMVYGDNEEVVRETFTDITSIEREDGWVVLFRGKEAILRVQEAHVQDLELVDNN